jgi:hypothetical protein
MMWDEGVRRQKTVDATMSWWAILLQKARGKAVTRLWEVVRQQSPDYRNQMSIFLMYKKIFPYLTVMVEKVPVGKGAVELTDC